MKSFALLTLLPLFVAAQSDSDLAQSTAVGAIGTVPGSTPTPITDLISSSSASGAAASASASAGPVYQYSCPQGLLSYYITVKEFTGVALSDALSYFGNWTTAVAGTLVNSTGSGDVGATRTYTLAGSDVSEQLVNVSNTGMELRQQWVSTAPLSIQGVNIYNFTDDLTVYMNTTTSATNVQLFINFCVNDQASGLALAAQALTGEVDAWYAALTNSSTASASGGAASGSASQTPSAIASASGSGSATPIASPSA